MQNKKQTTISYFILIYLYQEIVYAKSNNNYKTLTMAEFECFHRGECEIPRLNISNDMPMWKFKIRINIPK